MSTAVIELTLICTTLLVLAALRGTKQISLSSSTAHPIARVLQTTGSKWSGGSFEGGNSFSNVRRPCEADAALLCALRFSPAAILRSHLPSQHYRPQLAAVSGIRR
ncbi:hypothetical protein T484DRAFT_1967565, partial [Baffinella frigidus]